MKTLFALFTIVTATSSVSLASLGYPHCISESSPLLSTIGIQVGATGKLEMYANHEVGGRSLFIKETARESRATRGPIVAYEDLNGTMALSINLHVRTRDDKYFIGSYQDIRTGKGITLNCQFKR